MKVFVLGLDGATWDLLEPLIQEGLLPNLARLREQGSWGSLRSVFPPLSPVAWTGVMTGKNSGKHGIFEFIEHGHNPLQGRVNSSRAIHSSLLWEIAQQYGKKTVAGAVPMSYPVRSAKGFPGFFLGDFLSPASRDGFFERPRYLCRTRRGRRAVPALVDFNPRWRQRSRRARRLAPLHGTASQSDLLHDETMRVGSLYL